LTKTYQLMSYCHVCHLVDWVTTLATIDVVVKDKVSHNRYTLLCAHCSPWPQQTSEATAFRSVGLYRDACAKDSHFVGHHTIVNEVDAVRNFNGTSRSPNTITTPKNATMPGFLYPARFMLPPLLNSDVPGLILYPPFVRFQRTPFHPNPYRIGGTKGYRK